jgi:hypothetical protein
MPNQESRALTPDVSRTVGEILDSLYGGRFVKADIMAQEFYTRTGGDITALWIIMAIRLSAGRFLISVGDDDVDPAADTIGDMVVECPSREELLPKLAESLHMMQAVLKTNSNDERLWHSLGEVLCLNGECEMGYDCLMYACLMRPHNPYTWIGFYMAYDFGEKRDALLTRRVGEIRETIDVACESPQFPFDTHLRHFLAGARKELPGSGGAVR